MSNIVQENHCLQCVVLSVCCFGLLKRYLLDQGYLHQVHSLNGKHKRLNYTKFKKIKFYLHHLINTFGHDKCCQQRNTVSAILSFQPKFEAQFWPETEENYSDLPSARGKRNPQFSRNNFKTPFNLQEILDNNFSSETWNGTWVSDTEYVYR